MAKIAILGYGEQGRSAYEYWNNPSAGGSNQVTICDQSTEVALPNDVDKHLGPNHLANLDQFDVIIRSPSVHPNDIVKANSPDILKKVTTVTNEFMKVAPTRNIIGITGTKGKGTTSTLIAKMLEAAGLRVHLGGNIGTPPLDLLKQNIQSDDWVVLELANFQLIDLKYSPHIAVCLMVVPEHLDWHEDMADYVRSKLNLFAHQQTDDIAIYFADNQSSSEIASKSPGKKIPYMQKPGAFVKDDGLIVIDEEETPVIAKTEVKLLGEHNLQNVCAAITAYWQTSQDVTAIKKVLTTFSGLGHRLELVREVNGVKYYDDSFGTTPDTAIVAMKAFKESKVVVLGGSDKGIPFDKLADEVVNQDIRQVIAIGDTGPVIAKLLRERGLANITEGPKTMDDIIAAAKSAAQPGDVVLLSTGCASFGLFKNYKDRGEQFKKSVDKLS
ncbi:MAG: UDP-N-acetylmuramoyl-L-alanine--D-glutamate ligase [Candidatus Saccharimonadales bacterium]